MLARFNWAPCVAAGAVLCVGACTGGGSSPAETSEREALASRIAALEQRKSLIEDSNDIKRLQRAYGYYVDEALWDEVADLFADNGTIEIGLDGVYAGKARVREYLHALGGGRQGLAEGQLNEHMQLMPVVTVAPDGQTAKARWRALIMAGTLGEDAVWGEGPYENEYVKQNGVWKIQKLHWYQTMVVPYEGGWQHNADVNGGKWVSDTLPPDRPPSEQYLPWPETPDTYVPSYHFPNPVGVYAAPPGGTP
jgi:hypothetical protein